MNKLIYYSSPNKGLTEALEIFAKLRERHTNLTLYIANPGYYDDYDGEAEGIVNLGRLSFPDVIKHVRSSYCVLLPSEVPETFGLIYAESNAVGTPVLTYDKGAAREVLSLPDLQVASDKDALIKKFNRWLKFGRPVISGQARFRASNIARVWKDLLVNIVYKNATRIKV